MKKMKKIHRRNIINMSIIIILIAGASYANMNKSIEVETEIIDSGKIEKLIEEIAEVKSNNTLTLHSKVAGTIKEVKVSEGESVNTGDILLVIDEGTLNYDIESTQAMIDSLDAQFKEAIKAADKDKLSIAENNVKSTKATMEQAKKLYEDNIKLFESGSLSESELYKSRVNYEIVEVNFQNALSERSIIKKGASSNISDKFNSEIENLMISLDKMKSIREDYIIKSPEALDITEKYVEAGDYVMLGSKLIELTDVNKIYLQSEVLDSDAVNIEKGTMVNVIFEDNTYKGIVEKVYPKAYNKVSDLGIVQKRIKVDINILDDETILRLGQEVDVQFVEGLVEDGLRLPRDYVYDLDNKKYVLLLKNGLIVEREVTFSFEGEDYYQLESGLKLGDKIITNFGDELTIGSKAKEKDVK